jgi:hypothetical protein
MQYARSRPTYRKSCCQPPACHGNRKLLKASIHSSITYFTLGYSPPLFFPLHFPSILPFIIYIPIRLPLYKYSILVLVLYLRPFSCLCKTCAYYCKPVWQLRPPALSTIYTCERANEEEKDSKKKFCLFLFGFAACS